MKGATNAAEAVNVGHWRHGPVLSELALNAGVEEECQDRQGAAALLGKEQCGGIGGAGAVRFLIGYCDGSRGNDSDGR